MATRRIAKSAIDWEKFARLVPRTDRTNYNVFKARCDSYVMSVQMNPESPPEIDWNNYKSQIANKEVVSQLESAYRALKIPYPKDAVTPQIDQQEKECQVTVQEFCKQSNNKIKDAEELREKFKVMIPYAEMTQEEFILTFPEWNYDRDNPSIFPHPERQPGLTKEERAELAKPDGYPYSIP